MEEDYQKFLEGEVIDLKFELKNSKDKENIYISILSDINESLNMLIKQKEENERFNFGETIDYEKCIINLKNILSEYRRIYRIDF